MKGRLERLEERIRRIRRIADVADTPVSRQLRRTANQMTELLRQLRTQAGADLAQIPRQSGERIPPTGKSGSSPEES
jgi:N-glycosylase/DNA lyase